MRKIASFEKENLAKRFSMFLEKMNIENTLEPIYDDAKRKPVFHIWVHNEDDIIKATNTFDEFMKDPLQPKFDVQIEEVVRKEASDKPQPNNQEERPATDPLAQKQKFPYKTTFFFIFLCAVFFVINFMQEMSLAKRYELKQTVLLTPIQKLFLYDMPIVREKIDDIIIKYRLDTLEKLEKPPAEAQEEIEQVENMPLWQGLYDVVLKKLSDKDDRLTGPMFEKIRKGEIWRLFTPCILHSGLLHILFNMLWLWFLGKQMEPRVGVIRFVLFILIIGIISNTFQYLMGGPFFLGFSGVVMGMAGYIWVRQLVAPWEGYAVPKGIFLFIGFFILAMLGLQIVAFIFQVMKSKLAFTPAIANTAHIVGALTGMVLAKIPFFSWRSSE